MKRILLPLLLAASTVALAAPHHAISGTIVDRNGSPVERAIVSVAPGNVQLVTDQNGWFEIDYLRDESGERTKLGKRTIYEVEVFKAGYHVSTTTVEYKKGELILEPITLKEDTIRIVGADENIDPGQFPDRSHSAGAAYEGE
jgi:hypothetical protein